MNTPNKSRKITRPAHSLFQALHRITNIDRAILKAEWKEVEDATVFSLSSVNTHFDRKVTFHLQSLKCPYNLFDAESYTDVLEYVAVMDKLHTFNFNDILAIHNEVDNITLFGFSPLHNVIAIDVKKKLKLSPNLPY